MDIGKPEKVETDVPRPRRMKPIPLPPPREPEPVRREPVRIPEPIRKAMPLPSGMAAGILQSNCPLCSMELGILDNEDGNFLWCPRHGILQEV